MNAQGEKIFNNPTIRHKRDIGLNTAYDAIKNNDYQRFLDLLKKPYFDINQCASNGIQRADGITLHSDYTSITYAIAFEKPEWVELFLLMGANPFGGNYNRNPINLIDREKITPNNTKIAQILWQYQHPSSQLDTDSMPFVRNHEMIWRGPLISAITAGDAKEVERILLEGTIYTDDCCHNILNKASTISVASKSLDTVALLVERGANITDPETRQLLHDNNQEAWCKPIATLFALEKLKQITIMELFCVAQGNLEICREAIQQIRQQYQEKVNALKNGHAFDLNWEGRDVKPSSSVLLAVNSIPNENRNHVSKLSRNNSTLFVLPPQPHNAVQSGNTQNTLKAGAFLLTAGAVVATVSIGVLLKNPNFAIFMIPQVPMLLMGIAAIIGLLMLAAGIYMCVKDCSPRRAENLQPVNSTLNETLRASNRITEPTF